MSVPVSFPTTGSEDSLEKHYTRRTEIHETTNKLTQISHDAHARSSNRNFKYKIYDLPYTRQCSLSSIEILYRG